MARSTGQQHARFRQPVPSKSQPSRSGVQARPRLSPEDVEALAAKMRDTFKWDAEPKDFQLAAVQAQIEGVDMIVQAPTGSGKTALAAGPHLWPGNEKKFTLMVCPLLSLEEEMVQTFDTDYGMKAIALNSANGACSPLAIKDILSFKYQIILISPEMLQSRSFMDRVLRNASFMRHIISMFIDEAHCIAHWGADFRKKYGSLGKIRTFLPRGTPVIAVTATLTARVRRTIHHVLHFAQSEAQTRFINKGNDRPNVSIVVRACEHPMNSYADLDFVIPRSLNCPEDIPKTYIYVDNISVGGEIIDYLNEKIHSRRASQSLASDGRQPNAGVPDGLVRPFNATLSQQYRSLAMAHFRHGSVRILVCTDAAGMGCNLPDIDRVVQWKLPPTFSNFIQRAGRAARGRGRTGLAVLLVEKSAYSIDLTAKVQTSQAHSSKTKRRKTCSTTNPKEGSAGGTPAAGAKKDTKEVREYSRSHGVGRGASDRNDYAPNGLQPTLDLDASDEGLLAFVQSTTCRRRVWAEAFESELSGTPSVPCCDICHPALLDATRPPPPQPEAKPKQIKRGLPDRNAQHKLEAWREEVFIRDHPYAQYDATAILDDDLLSILVSCGPISHDDLAILVKDKWIFWEEYHDEIARYIARLGIVFTPLPVKPRAPRKAPQPQPPPESASASPSLAPVTPSPIPAPSLTLPPQSRSALVFAPGLHPHHRPPALSTHPPAIPLHDQASHCTPQGRSSTGLYVHHTAVAHTSTGARYPQSVHAPALSTPMPTLGKRPYEGFIGSPDMIRPQDTHANKRSRFAGGLAAVSGPTHPTSTSHRHPSPGPYCGKNIYSNVPPFGSYPTRTTQPDIFQPFDDSAFLGPQLASRAPSSSLWQPRAHDANGVSHEHTYHTQSEPHWQSRHLNPSPSHVQQPPELSEPQPQHSRPSSFHVSQPPSVLEFPIQGHEVRMGAAAGSYFDACPSPGNHIARSTGGASTSHLRENYPSTPAPPAGTSTRSQHAVAHQRQALMMPAADAFRSFGTYLYGTGPSTPSFSPGHAGPYR